MEKYLGFLLLSLLSMLSCAKPTPLPKEKEAFIGLWQSYSGFQMTILSDGTAKVVPISDRTNPDYTQLDVGITANYAKHMFVEFKGDSLLALFKPQLRYTAFRIDKMPYTVGDSTKMMLNGVLLYKTK